VRRSSEGVFEPLGAGRARAPWGPTYDDATVIEVLEPLVLPARADKLRRIAQQRLESVTVLLDQPHDPHNGAAVLRSAEAFGLQEVHVVTRHERFVAARSVTRGTELWLDVHQHEGYEPAIAGLVARGYELVLTHPEGELLPEDLAGVPRLALVLGNEHWGVNEALRAVAPRSVRIPMRGFVESLNVSVSAAILLASATRGRPADLSAEEQRHHYARGLFHTVTRASEVLAAARSDQRDGPPGP
jgi:tRNA (guanosine-2'-O-)-methyltransferase